MVAKRLHDPAPPPPTTSDQLGLVEPVDGLGEARSNVSPTVPSRGFRTKLANPVGVIGWVWFRENWMWLR